MAWNRPPSLGFTNSIWLWGPWDLIQPRVILLFSCDFRRRRAGDDYIINIHQHIGFRGRCKSHEKRSITLGWIKSQGPQSQTEFVKPRPGGLFQAIKSFEQFAYFVFVGWNKAWWLSHIYSFLKVSMQKGIVDIHLMNRPMLRNHKGQNSSNRCWLNHWTKGFFKIKPLSLMIPFCYQLVLVPLKTSISIKLAFKPSCSSFIALSHSGLAIASFIVCGSTMWS